MGKGNQTFQITRKRTVVADKVRTVITRQETSARERAVPLGELGFRLWVSDHTFP